MLGAASRAVWARAGGLPSIRMHAPTLKSQASSFRSSPQACVTRSVVTKTTATAVAPAGADSHKILLIGAGLFGRPVAHLWADAGHQLIVADKDPKVAQHVADELPDNVIAVEKPADTKTVLKDVMRGVKGVICAVPPPHHKIVAEAAAETRTHFVDLSVTEDQMNYISKLAMRPDCTTVFVAGAAIAPGLASIGASGMIKQFEEVSDITIRAGILPDQPNNALKYNLTWDSEGLVNTYIQPCACIQDYRTEYVHPLQYRESLIVDGVTYEAFSVAGRAGVLPTVFQGKVKNFMYKALRYPGHLDLIRFLLNDLRFKKHPKELTHTFRRTMPAISDDFLLCSVRGVGIDSDGVFREKTWWRKIITQHIGGTVFAGSQVASAATACATMDRILVGELPSSGHLYMENIDFDTFMGSPFARFFWRDFSQSFYHD